MQNPAVMRVVNGFGNLLHVAGGLPGRERLFAGYLRKTLPCHIGHRVKVLALEFADIVDRDDIGMLQLRRGLGFDPKPPNIVLSRQAIGPNHFHRHDAVKRNVPRLKHDPHPAPSDLTEQFIIAEALTLTAQASA